MDNKKQKIEKFIDWAFKHAGENPDNYIESFANIISIRQYRILYEKILDLVLPSKKVLDWGCGNGHFSYFLNYFNYDVVGYSLDEHPIVLKGNDKFKFVAGANTEPTKLPFNNNEFGAVVGVGVLEHVRETGGLEIASLRELYRITEPGGVFICAHLPNKLSWIELTVNILGLKKFTHPYRYGKKDIIKLWRAGGWKIELIKRYNWLPRNIFRRKLKSFANSRAVSVIYDLAESVFKLFFYPFNQNFLIIARKPTTGKKF